MLESKLATIADIEPHGMGCTYCDRLFEVGDEYVSSLTGMVEDVPLCTIVCPECAQKLEWLIRCPECGGCGEQGHEYGERPTQCRRCKGAGEVFGEVLKDASDAS